MLSWGTPSCRDVKATRPAAPAGDRPLYRRGNGRCNERVTGKSEIPSTKFETITKSKFPRLERRLAAYSSLGFRASLLFGISCLGFRAWDFGFRISSTWSFTNSATSSLSPSGALHPRGGAVLRVAAVLEPADSEAGAGAEPCAVRQDRPTGDADRSRAGAVRVGQGGAGGAGRGGSPCAPSGRRWRRHGRCRGDPDHRSVPVPATVGPVRGRPSEGGGDAARGPDRAHPGGVPVRGPGPGRRGVAGGRRPPARRGRCSRTNCSPPCHQATHWRRSGRSHWPTWPASRSCC